MTGRITLEDARCVLPTAKEIVKRATIPHVGWEMDNEIVAVRLKNGAIKFVGTSHGSPYEVAAKSLAANIKEIRGYVDELTALAAMEAK